MSKNFLQEALQIVRTRKYDAETQALLKERQLYSNPDFEENEKELHRVSLEYSKSRYQGVNNKELEDKLSSLLDNRENLMKKYGFSQKDFIPKRYCSICNDSGYTRGSVCKCVKKEMSKLMFRDSGIPYPEATFSPLDEKNTLYNFAEQFCKKHPNVKRKNVIFSGKVGTGKTYLVCAMANSLIKKGTFCLYTTAFELNERFAQMYYGRDQDSLYKDVLTDAEVLVIDDLGTETIREFTIPYLQFLLESRVNTDKSTLITTNLDPDDIQKHYKERIFSRVTDKSRFYILNFEGDDLRKNIRE